MEWTIVNSAIAVMEIIFEIFPFGSLIHDGLTLISNLYDLDKKDFVVKTTDAYADEASLATKIIIGVKPNTANDNKQWEFIFNSGADIFRGERSSPDTADLNYRDTRLGVSEYFYADGDIHFSGPIPPKPSSDTLGGPIAVKVLCPVDVFVITANGLTISKSNIEMDGATYNETDLNGDGKLDQKSIFHVGGTAIIVFM